MNNGKILQCQEALKKLRIYVNENIIVSLDSIIFFPANYLNPFLANVFLFKSQACAFFTHIGSDVKSLI